MHGRYHNTDRIFAVMLDGVPVASRDEWPGPLHCNLRRIFDIVRHLAKSQTYLTVCDDVYVLEETMAIALKVDARGGLFIATDTLRMMIDGTLPTNICAVTVWPAMMLVLVHFRTTCTERAEIDSTRKWVLQNMTCDVIRYVGVKHSGDILKQRTIGESLWDANPPRDDLKLRLRCVALRLATVLVTDVDDDNNEPST